MSVTAPVYIISKGRAESRLTARALDQINVPYRVVVEAQELELYASVIDRRKLLVLDPEYQRKYDTCDDLDGTKPLGSGPARNFVWDHAISEGYSWHWIMDDNIRCFYRCNRNRIVKLTDGSFLHSMEDFCARYRNVAMAGPQYEMFVPRRSKQPPFCLNTRIYSCNLIRNDVDFRWRGRYNEDTDLSLRMLKKGWCTVLFIAWLQKKTTTMTMKGGNTDTIYVGGTLPKSQMLVRLHPDIARLAWRWDREHHVVDYSVFKNRPLLRCPAPG